MYLNYQRILTHLHRQNHLFCRKKSRIQTCQTVVNKSETARRHGYVVKMFPIMFNAILVLAVEFEIESDRIPDVLLLFEKEYGGSYCLEPMVTRSIPIL